MKMKDGRDFETVKSLIIQERAKLERARKADNPDAAEIARLQSNLEVLEQSVRTFLAELR